MELWSVTLIAHSNFIGFFMFLIYPEGFQLHLLTECGKLYVKNKAMTPFKILHSDVM